MTTTQLVGVITLVGTLLVAGIQLGRLQQKIEELEKRIERVEAADRYIHGDVSRYLKGPE